MEEERNQNEMARDVIEMQADDLLVAGAVLILIGTTLTALGITRVLVTRSPQGAEGVVIGNGVESVGNVLQVLGKEKQYLIEPIEPRKSGIVGSWLQAIGNSGAAVVVQEGLGVGLFSFEDRESTEEETPESELEEEELKKLLGLYAIFNGIQAVGAFVEGDAISRLPPFPTQPIEVTGDYLTSIGAFLDAAGALQSLAEEELAGVILEFIGSWVQVGGASMGLYSLSTEGARHKKEFDEKYRYSYRRYTT